MNFNDKNFITLIIDSIVGSSKHEGYVDDGFNRAILEKIAIEDLSFLDAKKIVEEHYIKLWNNGKIIYIAMAS